MTALFLFGLWLAGIGGAILIADGVCAVYRWLRHRALVRAQLERLRR